MKFNIKKIFGNVYVKSISLMLLILLLVVFASLFWLKAYTRHGQKIIVPTLKGLQVEEAAAILRSSNLEYEVVDSIYEKRGVPGSVLEQIPREDSSVKDGRVIYLIVQAKAQQLVSIPDLADYSQRQGESLLMALGFTNIQIEEVSSDFKGLVIGAEYRGVPLKAGQKIPKGSPIHLIVGNGLGEGVLSTDSISNITEESPIND